MKGSSRDKQVPPGPQNKLNRTQQPPQPKPEYLDNTNYAKKKPTMYEKPSSQKMNMPPRAGSSQKINYKVDENMTSSKIQEAKHGLQLLKKRMVKNGMSREKGERPPSVEKRIEEPRNQPRGPSKQQQYSGYERQERQIKKTTPQMPQKKPEMPKKTQSKTINEEKPTRKQPPMPANDDYVNPNEEVPLNSNQDFMAILEREMAKQKSKGPVSQPSSKKGYQKPTSYDDDGAEIEMVQCSRGCGRQFSSQAIDKHEKVCEKVFQSKRKAFNSAAHRQAEAEGDFKIPPPMPSIKEEKKKPAKEGKMPKWKQQSAAFRAGLKQGKGVALTAEEKAATEQANGTCQCPVCGRTFNEVAGKRHIEFCQSKAKQMPKMNTTKKR